MTLKSKLQSHIRGWLPYESTVSTQHKPLEHVPYMVWWLTAGIAGGAGAAVLLVFFGDITGITSGYAWFWWYVEVPFLAWCIGSFIVVCGYLGHKKVMVEQKYDRD